MATSPDTDHGSWVREAVERFERPLAIYATRLVGDVETARDVVQDTFMRLCGQDHASVGDHLAEWLFTVCRNRALDVLRKEHRMTRLSDEQVNRCLCPAPGPLEAAENHDLGGAGAVSARIVTSQSTRSSPPQVSERVFLPGNQPDQRP